MTETTQIILSAVAVFYGLELIRRGVWGIINFVSDQILRKAGWDAAEQYTPMVEYTPFFRLFKGVADLTPKPEVITRTRI